LPSTFNNNFEILVGLRWDDGADTRAALLRALTDLYVQRPVHGADEERQFAELVLRLLELVDVGTRREVAQTLANYAGAPRVVIRRLATDVPAVAEAILKAEPMAEADPHCSPQPAVNEAPAEEEMAKASDLNELFFAASAHERRLIVTNLAYGAGAPAQRKSDAPMREASERLEAAALKGRPEAFVRGLEEALQVSRAQAQRIVNDPSGEPLVVAAKVLDMPIDVLQRILLCVNPAIGHSVRRIYNLTALYKDMSAESAWRLLTIWRQAQPMLRRTAKPAQATETEQYRRTRSAFTTSDHGQPIGQSTRMRR